MARTDLPFEDPLPGEVLHVRPATIHLKTSMLVPKMHSEEIPLTESFATMEALILEIGRRTKVNLIDRNGNLIDFLDVKLNGKNINFFQDGLATTLKPNDRVLIRLVPIGGG